MMSRFLADSKLPETLVVVQFPMIANQLFDGNSDAIMLVAWP